MSSAEQPAPIRAAIIAGSTRPGRKADTVARWVHAIGARRDRHDRWHACWAYLDHGA